MEKINNSERELMEPILGCSLLYYPKEEFANFLNFWEGIIEEEELMPSGMFYRFVTYLQQLFDASKTEEAFSKERKINYIRLQLELETDKLSKQKFTVWFEDLLSKDDPNMFSLSEELFYRYCWLCYKDKVKLVDKKPIPFKDKLFIKPTIGMVRQDEVFSKLSDSDEQGGTIYPFDIPFLDDYVEPMTSQFIVIAARPGNGKSSVLLRYMLNLAQQHIKSLYISLEMGKPQIRSRIASAISGKQIDKSDIDAQDKILGGPQFKELDQYIDIIVNGSHDADVILRRMEQAVENRGVKVILLDYMSLCRFASAKDEWSSLRELTSRLKRFAIEHDVLVVSCSQANRDSENHGLTLSDLFGSSTIEADADVVIGIERKESKGGFADNIKRGKIKILKNRDGEIKDFDVEIDYVGLNFNIIN